MISFPDIPAFLDHTRCPAADMHVFEVWAFQTPEEVVAHQAGELDVLADLEDWLDDFPDQFVGYRSPGFFRVGCVDDVAAVMFKLRWSDHIGDDWPPRSSGRFS